MAALPAQYLQAERPVRYRQIVDGDLLVDVAGTQHLGEGALGGPGVHVVPCGHTARCLPAGEDECGMPVLLPEFPQHLQGEFRHDDEPISIALGMADMQEHALTVDVCDGERKRFAQAQAHAVGDEPEGFEARLLGAADDACDRVTCDDVGKVCDGGWANDLQPWQGLTEHMLVVAADAVAIDLDEAPGSGIDEVCEVAGEVIGREIVRATIEVGADAAQRECE